MYACICAAVPEAELRSCVADGARTVEEVGDRCGAGTGCGTCVDRIECLLASTTSSSELPRLPLTA
ncbi:bacterioferritin-associated ferredoxin [Pseudonocardia hispaniensis]|uniref:Bacterioferritin-associated ferredoxin n=1 Tax=Pseudonocardia hispaniensis TaxID=904933 RepID=A0ABW1J1Q0_9PSEU